MDYQKTDALVLRRRAARERDAIITCYTRRFGKQRFMARGIKLMSAHLTSILVPMNRVQLDFVNGRSLPIIITAAPVWWPTQMFNSSIKTFAGFYFLSLLDTIVEENERDAALWQLTLGTMRAIDAARTKKALAWSLISAEQSLARLMGLGPALGQEPWRAFERVIGRPLAIRHRTMALLKGYSE